MPAAPLLALAPPPFAPLGFWLWTLAAVLAGFVCGLALGSVKRLRAEGRRLEARQAREASKASAAETGRGPEPVRTDRLFADEGGGDDPSPAARSGARRTKREEPASRESRSEVPPRSDPEPGSPPPPEAPTGEVTTGNPQQIPRESPVLPAAAAEPVPSPAGAPRPAAEPEPSEREEEPERPPFKGVVEPRPPAMAPEQSRPAPPESAAPPDGSGATAVESAEPPPEPRRSALPPRKETSRRRTELPARGDRRADRPEQAAPGEEPEADPAPAGASATPPAPLPQQEPPSGPDRAAPSRPEPIQAFVPRVAPLAAGAAPIPQPLRDEVRRPAESVQEAVPDCSRDEDAPQSLAAAPEPPPAERRDASTAAREPAAGQPIHADDRESGSPQQPGTVAAPIERPHTEDETIDDEPAPGAPEPAETEPAPEPLRPLWLEAELKALRAEDGVVDDEELGPVYLAQPPNKDPLLRIVGIGARQEHSLHQLGIWRLLQLAGWTPEQAARVGERIDFPGRILHEDWVGQARKLVQPKPEEPS